LDPEKTPKIPGTFIFTQPSSLGVTPDPSKTLQKRPQNHTKNDPKFRTPRRKLLCFGVVSLKTHFSGFFRFFKNLKKSEICQKFIKIYQNFIEILIFKNRFFDDIFVFLTPRWVIGEHHPSRTRSKK
jgi:hypothetical protein